MDTYTQTAQNIFPSLVKGVNLLEGGEVETMAGRGCPRKHPQDQARSSAYCIAESKDTRRWTNEDG
jgi:hypothetical protein